MAQQAIVEQPASLRTLQNQIASQCLILGPTETQSKTLL